MISLNHKIYGEGKPIVIIHGLFGMLDNWHTFAKSVSKHYQVITVDMRDHGKSPHSDNFSFDNAANDLRLLFQSLELDSAVVMGHSLGGKVAMRFTQLFPALVQKLVVVDIATKAYTGGHEHIFKAILSVPIAKISSRKDVDQILAKSIEQAGVRLFLMKNLKRIPSGGYEWKANLPQLFENYDHIKSAIPDELCLTECLFVRGGRSDYILEYDEENILAIFPNSDFVTIPDTGHWIHAEQPELLENEVIDFLG